MKITTIGCAALMGIILSLENQLVEAQGIYMSPGLLLATFLAFGYLVWKSKRCPEQTATQTTTPETTTIDAGGI